MENLNQPGCPFCRARPLDADEQPYPSTHACSVKYKCGSQVVYVIGDPGDYWEWEDKCPSMATLDSEIDDGK